MRRHIQRKGFPVIYRLRFECSMSRQVGLYIDHSSQRQVRLHNNLEILKIELHKASNVKAAKEGIDLHDINGKYPRVTFISPMDSAQVLIQCLGRVHRIKAKSKSVQKIVYVEGTIEEDVADNVRSKVTNIKALNDKDLGKGVLF